MFLKQVISYIRQNVFLGEEKVNVKHENTSLIGKKKTATKKRFLFCYATEMEQFS